MLDISPFPFTRDSVFYAFSILLLFAFVVDGKVHSKHALHRHLLTLSRLVHVADTIPQALSRSIGGRRCS